MPGQFVLTPKKRMLRVGASRVSRTDREESRPLSGPRQIAARIMYKTPQRTSSAPSPIRNIFASQFIAAPHNRTGINRGKAGFVPAGTTENREASGPTRASSIPRQLPAAPVVIFPIWIEHALNVPVQCPHDTDARKHRP